MCGISGFYTNGATSGDVKTGETLRSMVATMNHRGPDSSGCWMDENTGVAFGHNRLSIIDLTEQGNQPMISANRRFVIIYNGEIYNFRELRSALESAGCTFRGHTDTEVLLEGCAHWGIAATVKRLIGMFSFALWDREERILFLVRDRLGIKPLYWGRFGGLFLFGSELKALRAHPGWTPEINRDALSSYLRHNYIPAPATIYRNIFKLPPGSILTVRAGKDPQIDAYWDLAGVIDAHDDADPDVSDADAIQSLDTLLRDAVSRRMIADVPLGAFLSGGIDSSTVVALMQAQSSRPVHTYSIGFHESGFNEAHHAAEIAKHLGTEHTELYVTPREAMDVIPELPGIYDEPFADSSQIPTYLVSLLTRKYVTVALSGDGGDECFAGYTRYFLAKKLGKLNTILPGAARKILAGMIHSISPVSLDSVAALLPYSVRPTQFGHRLHKFSNILTAEGDEFYRRLVSHWESPDSVVIDGHEKRSIAWDPEIRQLLPEFVDRMRYYDFKTYLPDDILTKVDRASMAVSLEARVPLLDHRVVEYSWRLPMHMKIRHGQGKWLLRQVLYQYVPRQLVERPKMGFGVPIDNWLRGPLRDWAEQLLDENRIKQEGFFNPAPIREKWQQHLSGKHNWQYLLWDILMFQAWLEKWA